MGGFLSSDDMQDDASDRIRFLLNYLEMVKIGPKIFLACFMRFFVYALLHLMNFAKRNTLLRYMSHQYSICGCEIKVFWIDSASMKWPLFRVFWALTFSNIVQSSLNRDQKWSPIRQTQCLKNPSKFCNLA